MTGSKTPASLIQHAIDLIGEQEPDDYVLAPTTHAQEYDSHAPKLAKLLRSESVRAAAREYEELDKDALKAQGRFKKTANRANVAVLLAACFAACVLATGALATALPTPISHIAFLALGLSSAAAAAAARKWLHELRDGQLLQKWMTSRSAAEAQRLHYFDLITGQEPGDPTDESSVALLLRLEYFRRYQLDVQQAFLRDRGSDHAHAADQGLRLSGWAVFVASLSSLAGGMLAVFHPLWASLATLGVVGAAMTGFASIRDGINQDRRNAERYGRTGTILKRLRHRLPQTRQAVALGKRHALGEFGEAVHEQLSTEHRAWLEGTKATSAAVARLDQTLASVEEQQENIEEGAG